MKQTCFSALFLLLPLLAAPPAAGPLTVTVLDSAGLPVMDARISLSGIPESYATDPAGEIRISGLPAGRYSITVTADGFFPIEAKEVILLPDQLAAVAVALQPVLAINETVVVTATGTAYSVQEAPVRTELITRQIVDRHVMTTLADTLQATVSGVRMEMNCQNCGFMQVRMNGLEGPYTQILEDGLPSYSGVTAVYGLEQIPAAFVDQIEVVKGGNSALYGPGAVAGVVNLIRREPRDNRFRVDLMSGWHAGRPEQQAGASTQLVDLPGSLSADLYYRGSNHVPIDRDGDGFSDLGKRKLDAGGFGLFRRFYDGSAKLSVNGVVAAEFRRGGDQVHRPPHEASIAEQIDSRRYTLAVGWNHALSPRTYYNLRASHAYYGRQTYYGAGMDPNAYGDTRNPLWVSDLQLGHQAGKHSLLAGYQLSWEHVEDNAPAYTRTYGGTFQNHGLYLQDEWRATERFTVIGGARLDKSNQVDRFIVSPRAGVKYGLAGNVVWRATLSTGFRAPAVFDEDLHIAQVGGDGFVLQNDPGLSEEKSLSFTTGIDVAGRAFGRRFQLASNFFHTGLRDAFTLAEDVVTGQSFRRLLRVNGGAASVGGLSLDGSLQLARDFALRGGFTFQHARWSEPEPQFGARDFFRTPNRYGFAGFDAVLPLKIDLTGTFDYTGPMTVPHYAGYIAFDRIEKSPRFLVAGGVLSRTFDAGDDSRLRLFLKMQNIGDAYQPDLDKGPNRDSSYIYGPAGMRRLVAGLTWEF